MSHFAETPLWREGPNGRKTLCNACGLRYRKGWLFPDYRPVSSPTFVPSLHSNFHRSVIEMRKSKKKRKKKKKNKKECIQPELLPKYEDIVQLKCQSHFVQDSLTEPETLPICQAKRGRSNRPPVRYSPDPRKVQFLPEQFPGQSEDLDANPLKKCTHCEITECLTWWAGPKGPIMLCNPCGLRYKSGILFPEYRPAAVPTFVPLLHSNSHREVIEVRKSQNDEETHLDLFQTLSHPYIQVPSTFKSFNPLPSVEAVPPQYLPHSLPLKKRLEARKKKEKVQFLPEQCPRKNEEPDAKLLRICFHCQMKKTTQWRKGPNGNTLCNACGLRYNKGTLFPEYRPAASPTFVPLLHSSSLREVLKMRESKNKEETSQPALFYNSTSPKTVLELRECTSSAKESLITADKSTLLPELLPGATNCYQVTDMRKSMSIFESPEMIGALTSCQPELLPKSDLIP